MNTDKIANEIISSIEKAHSEYAEWSDGSWLWNAPEYFTTVRIAETLISLKEIAYIELEHSVKDALEIAGGGGPGRRSNLLRVGGRFDILLYGAEENDVDECLPIAAIEVKVRPWDSQKVDDDVCRLLELLRLRRGNSIQFGVLAFHVSYDNSSKEKADKKIEKFLDRLKNQTVDTITSSERYNGISQEIVLGNISVSDDGVSAWCAGVMILQREGQ